MARNKRSQYEPCCCGWVAIHDMHNKLLLRIDCREGGAQEVLRLQFDRLQAEGWKLEGRKFDWQFANRNDERILIGIYLTDPTKKPVRGHSSRHSPIKPGWE